MPSAQSIRIWLLKLIKSTFWEPEVKKKKHKECKSQESICQISVRDLCEDDAFILCNTYPYSSLLSFRITAAEGNSVHFYFFFAHHHCQLLTVSLLWAGYHVRATPNIASVIMTISSLTKI